MVASRSLTGVEKARKYPLLSSVNLLKVKQFVDFPNIIWHSFLLEEPYSPNVLKSGRIIRISSS